MKLSGPILGLLMVCLAGCNSVPPRAKDAHDVLILAENSNRPIRTNLDFLRNGSSYYFAVNQFEKYTGGKLVPISQQDAAKIIMAAHAGSEPVNVSDVILHLGPGTERLARMMPVAKSYGVRFIVVVHDAHIEKFENTLVQRGRLKLVGGLGFSYQRDDPFFHYRAGLEYSVWDCAKGRYLFRVTTETECSGAGGIWRMRGLWPTLGMAIVQKINPSSTSVVRNFRPENYSLDLDQSGEVRYWTTQFVDSGTLGVTNYMKLVKIRRIGTTVEATVTYRNDWDDPMSYQIAAGGKKIYCKDINRGTYPVTKATGPMRGRLNRGQSASWTFQFDISDQNVDFVTLQVPLKSRVGEFEFDHMVTFQNVQLF